MGGGGGDVALILRCAVCCYVGLILLGLRVAPMWGRF